MKNLKLAAISIIIIFSTSCTQKLKFSADFDNTNNRVWVGKDFWSIPLEDWKVENGWLHCIGTVPRSRVYLLTHTLAPGAGNFEVSVKISLADKGDIPGTAGLLLGVNDPEDTDVKAACYFGRGVNMGISLNGFAFINNKRADLPEGFDFSEFIISVSGNDNQLKMKVTDKSGKSPEVLFLKINGMYGLVAVANNLNSGGDERLGNSKFSFDDLLLSGSKVIAQPENAFGPVFWTMHTLSQGTVKMMALLPPIGNNDNQEVSLQLNENGIWKTVATEEIEPDSRTAVFKLENWDATKDVEYRVEYIEKGKNGKETAEYYNGTIMKDPVDRPLKLGALTCQYYNGFPYTPLVENLTELKPDLLYFSGDQLYEGNGGYPIKRQPADVSILSYLGKYYMFGWAFGDLMRNVPTICTPDDHDVFQGNLWGQGGIAKPGGVESDDTRGFVQSVEMVNVVNRTQCGQLPDPYDATPIEQGMSVWYTGLTYGRVSFAIITDRVFKTGPEAVSDWKGRKDHIKESRKDLSFLDKTGLEMIGERQTKFLSDWMMDWKGADMKVLLSQTVFANVATHHGTYNGYLYGDLDSGGWPKSGRDKIIRQMRKVGAFHINGDQHIASLVQYGLDNHRDAGWSYCTPAISVGYQRWFRPDELGLPVEDRPEHGFPNTGNYTDAFGNKNYVYAIGNPAPFVADMESRYNQAVLRASGFGMITFNQQEGLIDIDAWRFKADVKNPNPIRDQIPGWPFQITQNDNFGIGAEYMLPEISVNKPNQVIQIWNENTGEVVQIYRLKGGTVQPSLFENGTFTLIIGEGDNKQTLSGLKTQKGENTEKVSIEL